ncbi:MAG: hypothetical protein JO362_24780 [Streptomycetaceae bacterium]|nr:hypothetical protein [Streptomycetaceae bacterium]
MIAATWGLAMPGFGNGIHLTWWYAPENLIGPFGHQVVLAPDFDPRPSGSERH